jgi:hypothetical protein
MQRNTAAGACAPSQTSFRPVLVRSRTAHPATSAEAEVKLLRAELAKVRREFRDLAWATNAFVRTVI